MKSPMSIIRSCTIALLAAAIAAAQSTTVNVQVGNHRTPRLVQGPPAASHVHVVPTGSLGRPILQRAPYAAGDDGSRSVAHAGTGGFRWYSAHRPDAWISPNSTPCSRPFRAPATTAPSSRSARPGLPEQFPQPDSSRSIADFAQIERQSGPLLQHRGFTDAGSTIKALPLPRDLVGIFNEPDINGVTRRSTSRSTTRGALMAQATRPSSS